MSQFLHKASLQTLDLIEEEMMALMVRVRVSQVHPLEGRIMQGTPWHLCNDMVVLDTMVMILENYIS